MTVYALANGNILHYLNLPLTMIFIKICEIKSFLLLCHNFLHYQDLKLLTSFKDHLSLVLAKNLFIVIFVISKLSLPEH